MDISVNVLKPAEVIWLNSVGLQIQDATFRAASGDMLPVETVPGGDQFIGFALDRASSAPVFCTLLIKARSAAIVARVSSN